jgi:hypothetical protein
VTRSSPAESTVPAWIAAAIIVIALAVGIGFILYTLHTPDDAPQSVVVASDAPAVPQPPPPAKNHADAPKPTPAAKPAAPTPPAPPRPRAEIYVLGEVPKPGVYALKDSRTTVKQVLQLAGLKPDDKAPRKVDLNRAIDGQTKKILEDVPVGAIWQGLNDDVLVQPNDKIMVLLAGP